MKPFAFVFPGQGSQTVGMLDAWGDHPVVMQTLAEASEALGEDIAKLIHEGPKEALALTTNTQPVMLVAAIAAFRAWMAETGAAPAAVAGHSLGEYTAFVAAGALTLADAVPLVRFRAAAMQEAVPVGTGAMAAILGLDAAKVIAGCAEVTAGFGPNSAESVQAANFNDPAQTVISGSKAAVDKACELIKSMGAKRALLLPVSAPFHSQLMVPAGLKLRERLVSVNLVAPTIPVGLRLRERLATVNLMSPSIPVINNIDVAVQTDPTLIKEALFRQASGPVRWVECIQAIKARGLLQVVECGPGKVLAGLTKRIDAEMTGLALYDPATLAEIKGVLA